MSSVSGSPAGTPAPSPSRACPAAYSADCTPFFTGACATGYTSSTCGSCIPITPTKSPHATGSHTKSPHATGTPIKSPHATISPSKSPKATSTPPKTPTRPHALRELAATSHTPSPTPGCGLGQYAMGTACSDCPPGYAACGVAYAGTCGVGYVAVASTPGAPGFPGLTCGACVSVTPSATPTKPPPSRSSSSHATGTPTHTRASTGSTTHTRSQSKPLAPATPSRSGTRAATPSKTQRPT